MSGSPVFRVGLVGVGIMGASYARILEANPQATVTAVASRRPERAQALATALPAARGFASWQELIASGEVDGVCIATPDHLHTEIMLAAAEAGLHIACEKPFTTSVTEADQAVAAIERAGVTAMTLYNHRWIPAYAQAKAAITAGDIGRPVMVSARKNDRITVALEMLSWSTNSTSAWFLSSHDIDLACWFLDDTIASVRANSVSGVLREHGVDTTDGIQILASYASGATGTFESCWIYPNTFPTMVDSYVQVVGTEGVIQLDRQKEQIAIASPKTYTFPRNLITIDLHGELSGAGAAALNHWVTCVVTGAAPIVDLASSRQVTAVLEAAHQSLATGADVQVR